MAVLFASGLSACSSNMDAMVQTVRTAVSGGSTASTPLNPNFRYLRVTTDGRVAFLALGNVDKDPHGPVEVWYSAQKEVVRLQNGRIVGAVGLTTEWRNVLLPALPSWSAAADAGQPIQWVRVRDVMPGYRIGVRDALSLQKISPPADSALQGIDPSILTWFEERDQSGRRRVAYAAKYLSEPSVDEALPTARYAVDLHDGKETVVYGEQCLSAEICFTWQRWTAAKR